MHAAQVPKQITRSRDLANCNPMSCKRLGYSTLLSTIIISLTACDTPRSAQYSPTYGESPAGEETTHYVFGVHPLHNPQRLHDVFGPLADLLTEKIDGATFKIEASRNYAAFDEKLYAGKFEFALPNPYQTLLSLQHGYRVFGKMGDDERFRGIILTRRDRLIRDVMDLEGQAVCFPAPTALAATMMPQMYLQEHGLDVENDIETKYVGSQESSIMNVLLGNVAAGATWPPPWEALSAERPRLLNELEVKWETEPLINNGLVVRLDVPLEIVGEVSEILFHLHETESGRNILERMALTQFESASDDTYQVVSEFLASFHRDVRPIEH